MRRVLHTFVNGVESKKCRICSTVLPLTEFDNCKTSYDKLAYFCKVCAKHNLQDYRAKNRDKVAAYQKQYRESHREIAIEYHKNYRKENKEYFQKKSKERKLQLKHFLFEQQKQRRHLIKLRAIEVLGGACADCNLRTNWIEVFDFHHRTPSEKDICISDLLSCSWEKALVELKKCDLLCSNCHRTRHAKLRLELESTDTGVSSEKEELFLVHMVI